MIIALPTKTSGEKSFISEHFSKCNFYYIFDTEKNEGHVYANKLKKETHGGGRKVAAFLMDLNVDTIIAKEVGHGAMDALQTKNVKVYICTEEIVKKNIESFLAGELVEFNG